MRIHEFKRKATVSVKRYQHRLNVNTEIEETTYRIGPFLATYLVYHNLITGRINSRKRRFMINGKGLSKRAFYKAIKTIIT